MTPLAQSNIEHGEDEICSDFEHASTPVDHVDSIYSKGVWYLPQPFHLTN